MGFILLRRKGNMAATKGLLGGPPTWWATSFRAYRRQSIILLNHNFWPLNPHAGLLERHYSMLMLKTFGKMQQHPHNSWAALGPQQSVDPAGPSHRVRYYIINLSIYYVNIIYISVHVHISLLTLAGVADDYNVAFWSVEGRSQNAQGVPQYSLE